MVVVIYLIAGDNTDLSILDLVEISLLEMFCL